MQGRGDIYLAYTRDDADEVGAILHVLREAGWTLTPAAHLDPQTRVRTAEEAIAAARAVVVCWSHAAASDGRVIAEAQLAMATGKLVLAALDHAPAIAFAVEASATRARLGKRPARPAVQRVDLTQWRDGPTPTGRAELLRAVEAYAGAPQRPAAKPADHSWRKGAILAAGLLGGLAGLSMVGWETFRLWVAAPLSSLRDARELPSRAPTPADPISLEPTPIRVRDGGAAYLRAQWAATPKSDHAALLRLRNTARADAARAGRDEAAALLALTKAIERDIAQIERAMWRAVEASEDASAALDASAAYRRAFPEGQFAEQGRNLDRRWRALTARTQERLATLGFVVRDPPGVPLDDTRRAVLAFEVSNGIAPRGLIDDRLAAALGIAGVDGAATNAGAPAPAASGRQNTEPVRPRQQDRLVSPAGGAAESPGGP